MKLKKTTKAVSPPVSEEPTTPQYTDLHQIMDYSRSFNIIYSGVEQEDYFTILYDMGIRNFLMSYHYVQNRHLSMQQQYGGLGVKFFIDSGAHTYQNDPKYAEYDLEYWENHLKKYLRWVEKNRDMIFAIANFDFENVVGAEKVKEWNEKYFEPFMLRTGIPVCFVWHQNSYYDWEFYCKRYPYVGFSSVNTEGVAIELKEYMDKLRIAEKHDALVHGFGMTRTAMLTQLPFYTADSTTWLVGLQYGEMNFWTGTKMTRLKKDKWKGAMLSQLVAKGFDETLLLQEDTTEVIKANVYAFIEAEEFVQDRLKSRMYWLKQKAQVNDVNNLPPDFFPDVQWFFDGCQNSEEYARKMNINPELSEVNDFIMVITSILNWDNPEYDQLAEVLKENDFQMIRDTHTEFINKIVPDVDTMIQDLADFFKSCISGECETLLQLGTNFDRLVRERDEYITDEEFDEEDVPEYELKNIAAKMLPAPKEGDPAPEISELDDEIFREQGIEPIRDDHGRLIKGQRKVSRPKKLYSEKYPKLACDRCINAQTCPEYKPGYVCAYNEMFKRYNTRDMADIIQSMQGIADLSMQRLQRAMMTEVLNGGVPTAEVSQIMNQTMALMTQLQRMYETGSQEVIRQTKVIRADGSQEMTTQVSNPQSGGILSQLFSKMAEKPEEPNTDFIDVEPTETPAE